MQILVALVRVRTVNIQISCVPREQNYLLNWLKTVEDFIYNKYYPFTVPILNIN